MGSQAPTIEASVRPLQQRPFGAAHARRALCLLGGESNGSPAPTDLPPEYRPPNGVSPIMDTPIREIAAGKTGGWIRLPRLGKPIRLESEMSD